MVAGKRALSTPFPRGICRRVMRAVRTYVRVGRRRRSSTPTSTRSTRRSSSATIRACVAGRSSSAGGSCWRRATRPRRAASARRWAAGRPGGCARARSSSRRGCRPTPRRARRRFACSTTRSPLVEGLSIDEAFLDVRGLERISGTPTEIAARLRRDVRERVGLPITVGVARTKFLAKVASGVAKPDGLLVVPPDRELAFLHPLPVERLWGVGPATASKLHERGSRPSARWPGSPRPCSCRCSAGRRAGTCTRSPTTAIRGRCVVGRRRGSIGSQRALGRSRKTAEAVDAVLVSLVDRVTRRMRTAGRVGRTVVLRLRFDDFSRATRSHTLPQPTAHTQTILATARWLLAAAMPMIERRGLTLVGIAVANLEDDSALQLDVAVRPLQRQRPRRRARRSARALRIDGSDPRRAARPRPGTHGAAPSGLKDVAPSSR